MKGHPLTRKSTRKHGRKVAIERDTLSKETHREIWARLAAVKNMHGAPGPRKPKKN